MLLLQWARNRVRRGFAPIILIVGKQRVGKTFLALRLAYEMDKLFDAEKRMFFDILSFAKAVKQYNRKVLILDEAGIELDTYRYSDLRQRCFSHIVQSQAYKQNTLIICLPHASDLARCHRKYVDVLVVVPARGMYIAYKPSVYYWDMNEIDIRTKKIEVIYETALPPEHLINIYKNRFESQIKEDILSDEIDRLGTHLDKIAGKSKPKIQMDSIPLELFREKTNEPSTQTSKA